MRAWDGLKEAEKSVVRWAALCTGLGVILTTLGVINKTIIADPIAKSQERTVQLIADESRARQAADEVQMARIREFASGEADSLTAYRITRLARQIAAVQATVVEVQTQADSIVAKVLKGKRQTRGNP